jgi:hypothetical protein
MVALLVGSASLANGGVGVWAVYDPLYIAQGAGGLGEILPAEDMDNHAISWGPVGQPPNQNPPTWVRFWPSFNWGAPAAGDQLCWLYDQAAALTWWQGTFIQPSTSVYVQLKNCDNNDGWADIFVDGVLECSYNSLHANFTDVGVFGQGLNNQAHTVEIFTRAGGGDVSIDYVSHVPEPASLSLLALGGLALIRRRRMV